MSIEVPIVVLRKGEHAEHVLTRQRYLLWLKKLDEILSPAIKAGISGQKLSDLLAATMSEGIEFFHITIGKLDQTS